MPVLVRLYLYDFMYDDHAHYISLVMVRVGRMCPDRTYTVTEQTQPDSERSWHEESGARFRRVRNLKKALNLKGRRIPGSPGSIGDFAGKFARSGGRGQVAAAGHSVAVSGQVT